MHELTVRVAQRHIQADGICSFTLVAEQGGLLPPFTAGAHIDVHLAPGLIRQYSLCNDPADGSLYRIAVLLEPQSRGGSATLHAQVQPGDSLHISAPRNHFGLATARHSLLLAGGIGITPLLAMARTLHARQQSFTLHYCGRSASRMAFLDELAQSPFASCVQLHTDDGPAAQRLDAAHLLAAPATDARLYVCGPQGFMAHVLDTAARQGWAPERLHREYFAAAPASQAPGAAADAPFEVRVASTGLTCVVLPGQSVVEALQAQGVEIPVSCEAGVCGTCLTRVLAGTPDHRDTFLTSAERSANEQFTPCCSRSHTPLLVLDL